MNIITDIDSDNLTACSAPKNRFTDVGADKLRGGYYTSSDVAEWMCEWAITDSNSIILEPSCGDGAFLEAAAKKLLALKQSSDDIASQLIGIEIAADQQQKALNRLQSILGEKSRFSIYNDDFFAWSTKPNRQKYDVVLGNPPFIRYQAFPEPHRTRAMDIMESAGLKRNRLTNIWVPFVVAATENLRDGGRMALVLPAEVLQVTYAGQLREYLVKNFGTIELVACNELFFDGAEQEVILLLAANKSSKGKGADVSLTNRPSVQSIVSQLPSELLSKAQTKTLQQSSEKWLKYFLSNRQIDLMRALREHPFISKMSDVADTRVGVVTGKNAFFVLNKEDVQRLGIEKHCTPIVSRANQLKGSVFSSKDWKNAANSGARVYLLNPGAIERDSLDQALLGYVISGEVEGWHQGYKCSIREPWYDVPTTWVPDGLVFRQIYDFPRIVRNRTDATSTDTIHRFRVNKGEPDVVIARTYTWLTAASAEIEGRSYGGGVLELEPREAGNLLIPAIGVNHMHIDDVDETIKKKGLNQVLEHNARAVLQGELGLSHRETDDLRDIWVLMRNRRNSRVKRDRMIT